MAGKGSVFTLKEAAAEIGIAPVTLKRWLLTAKVGEVARDRNGWRMFSEEDISRIKAYADRVTLPEES